MKDVPTVFLTGWYDYFAEGVLRNFEMLAKQRHTPQKLIVGPWPHPTGEDTCGDAYFGTAAVDQRMLMADWFDHWMKGMELKALSQAPVAFFRMGGGTVQQKPGKLSHGGTWLQSSAWPPPAKSVKYFLAANTGLSSTPVQLEGARIINYDPKYPAPTIGGRYGMGGWSPNCAADQVCSRKYLGCDNDRPLNERQDVLSFEGQALKRSVEVTDTAQTKLWVTSDARDADLVVKLIDVYPNGFAMLLGMGQLRLRYRDGFDRSVWMKSGEHYAVALELGTVSNLFAVGHRIRFDITSSDYPRLEPNPLASKATIHFSASEPSRIELPVIER